MTHRIVILGAGTGGTLVANRLRRIYSQSEAQITVVSEVDRHLYQPGLLFVPFGLTSVERITRPATAQLHSGITFIKGAVDNVDIESSTVLLENGQSENYDLLVIATGAVLVPEETEGLSGSEWNKKVFSFYSPEGAMALSRALAGFEGGTIVVNVIDMPIKCPVSPLEFCFLADWYFHRRNMRDKVRIVYATPLDGAFTTPVASQRLAGMLAEKGIELVTEFNTGEVAGDSGRLISYDGREVEFDLAVIVPLHSGAPYVGRSPGLGDELNFVQCNMHTLQSICKPNIFAIGDATDLPASKAGSVTHFEGGVLVGNIRRFLSHQSLTERFDGHSNCFIESGFNKALLIDYNYDTEPLPGHFPFAAGLPLLRESRFNHLGKMLFQWVYWNILLPGRDLPGLKSAMPLQGKHFEPERARH